MFGSFYQFSTRGFGKGRLLFFTAMLLLTLPVISANAQVSSTRDSGESDAKPETVETLPLTVTAPTILRVSPATFTVPITISNVTGDGIFAFQFNIIYDPAVIDPSGANFGCSTVGTMSETANLAATCNVKPDGTLRVTVSGTGNLAGSGTLLKLTFTTDPASVPGNFSPLTFQNVFFFNGAGLVSSNAANGKITLVGPTAANVSVAGRILSAGGQPVGKASVVLTEPSGNTRATISSPLGYYQFDGVGAGQNYVIGVKSKIFVFEPRVLTVNQEMTDVNLISQP